MTNASTAATTLRDGDAILAPITNSRMCQIAINDLIEKLAAAGVKLRRRARWQVGGQGLSLVDRLMATAATGYLADSLVAVFS